MTAPDKRLPRSFFERDACALAPMLLNKLLVHGDCVGRIVEVEAYAGADDPASHGFRGRTPRNDVMFGPPGRLYVYFTYGMHYCCNVVCGDDGESAAVLIRAVEPILGKELIHARRSRARNEHQLTNGPAKICEAFAIGREQNGADLVAQTSTIAISFDEMEPPADPARGPRIGIREGLEYPWRFWVKENSWVSRHR